MIILVLSFEENLSQLQSNSQTLLCYGTTVGFSIIVSEDILRKLFSDKNPARDKIEILKNVLAVFLFAAVGAIRVVKYHYLYSREQLILIAPEFSDSGEICINHNKSECFFKDLESTLLLESWQSS